MCRVCILTDSTAQFTSPFFPGNELVSVLPMHIDFCGQDILDHKGLMLSDLPVTAKNGLHPKVKPPTNEEIKCRIESLGQRFQHIIMILFSTQLISAAAQTQASVQRMSSKATLHIIDSNAISVGLGLLVQIAAEAAQHGMPVEGILQKVRASISHIYTIFCVHNLTYLQKSGQVDPAQALIGEMLGLRPLLLLENGRLIPIQKARNSRHLVEIMYEFIAEFNSLKHMALLQGIPPCTYEVRNLYERIRQEFPTTPYSEHTLGYPLAAVLGPHSLGLVVMEKADRNDYRNCHR